MEMYMPEYVWLFHVCKVHSIDWACFITHRGMRCTLRLPRWLTRARISLILPEVLWIWQLRSAIVIPAAAAEKNSLCGEACSKCCCWGCNCNCSCCCWSFGSSLLAVVVVVVVVVVFKTTLLAGTSNMLIWGRELKSKQWAAAGAKAASCKLLLFTAVTHVIHLSCSFFECFGCFVWLNS